MTNLRSMVRRIAQLHDPEANELERLTLRVLKARSVDPLPDDGDEALTLLRVTAHAIDSGFPAGGTKLDLADALRRDPAFDECPEPDHEFHELRTQLAALIPPSPFE